MFKQREQVTGVAFYCKDCERIVDAHQIGRKFVYSCNICKTKNVAFGTEKSVRSYFKFDEVAPTPAAPAAPGTPAIAGISNAKIPIDTAAINALKPSISLSSLRPKSPPAP